eukprot:664974-Rhodomonas_salina.1
MLGTHTAESQAATAEPNSPSSRYGCAISVGFGSVSDGRWEAAGSSPTTVLLPASAAPEAQYLSQSGGVRGVRLPARMPSLRCLWSDSNAGESDGAARSTRAGSLKLSRDGASPLGARDASPAAYASPESSTRAVQGCVTQEGCELWSGVRRGRRIGGESVENRWRIGGES